MKERIICGAHYKRLHDGLLYIEGDTEANARFFYADGTEYGGRPDAEHVGIMGHAFGALRHMGWGETETKRALGARARSHVGAHRQFRRGRRPRRNDAKTRTPRETERSEGWRGGRDLPVSFGAQPTLK